MNKIVLGVIIVIVIGSILFSYYFVPEVDGSDEPLENGGGGLVSIRLIKSDVLVENGEDIKEIT